MGYNLLILGQPGRGKTTSIRTLPPEETFIINVEGKHLTWPKWKQQYTKLTAEGGNLATIHKASDILKTIKHISDNRPEIKTIVIDDFTYVFVEQFMLKALEKGYDKYNEIGKDAWELLKVYKHVREDLCIVYTMHIEESNDVEGAKTLKAKTLGKMIDNYITVEGLFSVVLYADIEKVKKDNKISNNYIFMTQSNGLTTAKSPMGMFESDVIPNDLNEVIKVMKEYNV
jgi:hypothetical protein